MSKSSSDLEAEVREATTKRTEISIAIDGCLIVCFSSLNRNEDLDALQLQMGLQKNLDDDGLQNIQDIEILTHLKQLISAIEVLLSEENDSKLSKTQGLLDAYVWIIHNAIQLGGKEAQKSLNKRDDYLAVLANATFFLEDSSLVNYEKLDASIGQFAKESSPYTQQVKQFCLHLAQAAIFKLLASLTKAVSLLSIFSKGAMTLAVPLPANSGVSSSDDIDEIATSRTHLKTNFQTIFEKHQPSSMKPVIPSTQDAVTKASKP